MTTHWVQANGVATRYELTGGTGRLLVLVHEMGGSLESWDDVMPLLARSGPVLRYDQRGTGLSEKHPGPVTIEDLAADLAGLIDTLAIVGPVAIAGTAVGAAIAAAFAALYPVRAACLILLAPATGMSEERRLSALKRIEAIERDGVRAAFADEPAMFPARFRTLRLAADPKGLCAIWRMLADLDISPLLPTIACPTLVAAATRDTARPPEETAAVGACIPGARFTCLDATHFMAIEDPALTAETIAGFLKETGFW